MGDLVVLSPDTRNQVPVIKHAGGRPTLYTEELARGICDHIRRGVTKEAAAAAHGITRETLYAWARDREQFSDMLMRADAEAEITFTESLRAGAVGDPDYKGDPRMSVEWLKRRRRADYGDTLDIRKVDTEQLLKLLSVAAAGTGDAITEDGLPAIESGKSDI